MQGLTSETRLPQLCEQLKALLTALVGHLPQVGDGKEPRSVSVFFGVFFLLTICSDLFLVIWETLGVEKVRRSCRYGK